MLFLVFLHRDVAQKRWYASLESFFLFPSQMLSLSLPGMLNTPGIFCPSQHALPHYQRGLQRWTAPKPPHPHLLRGNLAVLQLPYHLTKKFFAFPGVPGVILIVGHGSSLASLTRALTGLPSRDSGDFAQMVRKVRGFYSIRKLLGCFIILLIRRLFMQQDKCSSMPAPMTSAFSFQRESHAVLAKHWRWREGFYSGGFVCG